MRKKKNADCDLTNLTEDIIKKTEALKDYFSEYALIKYRVFVEIQYFIALKEWPIPQLADFPEDKVTALQNIASAFSLSDAEEIKAIERQTNPRCKSGRIFSQSAI